MKQLGSIFFNLLSLSALTSAQFLRKLQQSEREFVRLNTARITNYPADQVDQDCPIFIVCNLNTTRTLTPTRVTCISESEGTLVSDNVWVYSRNQITTDPFVISLTPQETIQCRISTRINGFVQFFEFQNGDQSCTFKFEDFVQKSVQTCRLVDGGNFSLTTRSEFESQSESTPDNGGNPFQLPELNLDRGIVMEGVVVAVMMILFATAFALICNGHVRSNRRTFGMPVNQERETEGNDGFGNSPTVFQAGTPQSKASSKKGSKKGPIVFLNPSSFSSPAQWFTNRLFMLGEPETYSQDETPTHQTDHRTRELEMQNLDQTM